MAGVDRYIMGLVNNLENLTGTLSEPENITGHLANATLRGMPVELRINGIILQWKYEDEDSWTDLIDLSTLDYETLQNLPTIDGVEIKGEIAEMIISAIQDLLDEKVDKVYGKELSTNDFTNELKSKLDDIEDNAQENVIENINVNGDSQTIDNKTVNLTIPTNVSELNNDSGYLTAETDPTVPQWAKQPQKPAYTATEVGALPDDTFIPTNVSDLQNDANYIDASGAPVQSVNNQTGDVVITAQSIGALTQHQDISGKADRSELSSVATSGSYNDLTNKPTIPSNVSELNNDSGYLITETDPTVPAWAKAQTKPTYTANEVGALPSTTYIPNKVSDLTNDASYVDDQYVDDAITAALADIVGIEYHVCTAQEYNAQTYIPTLQGKVGIIYLVPKHVAFIGSAVIGGDSVSENIENNIYYEFIYNGQSFEMIGDTQIKLGGYLKNTDISTNTEVQSVISEIFGGE